MPKVREMLRVVPKQILVVEDSHAQRLCSDGFDTKTGVPWNMGCLPHLHIVATAHRFLDHEIFKISDLAKEGVLDDLKKWMNYCQLVVIILGGNDIADDAFGTVGQVNTLINLAKKMRGWIGVKVAILEIPLRFGPAGFKPYNKQFRPEYTGMSIEECDELFCERVVEFNSQLFQGLKDTECDNISFIPLKGMHEDQHLLLHDGVHYTYEAEAKLCGVIKRIAIGLTSTTNPPSSKSGTKPKKPVAKIGKGKKRSSKSRITPQQSNEKQDRESPERCDPRALRIREREWDEIFAEEEKPFCQEDYRLEVTPLDLVPGKPTRTLEFISESSSDDDAKGASASNVKSVVVVPGVEQKPAHYYDIEDEYVYDADDYFYESYELHDD